MIKAILFDLDGTLVESKQIHADALNFALKQCGYEEIPDSDFKLFDGRPTKEKLKILAAADMVPEDSFKTIESFKQKKTIELYGKLKRGDKIFSMLSYLKNNGYKIACCTNSVRETTSVILQRLEIEKFFDLVVTNEDVVKSKPAPDIYKKALDYFGVSGFGAMVFEDHERGLASAHAAGIPAKNIIKVNDPFDLSINFVLTRIQIASILR